MTQCSLYIRARRAFIVACLCILPSRLHAQTQDSATKARNAATLAIGLSLLDADEAAQREAIKWVIGDWTYTSDAPYPDPSRVPLRFALGGHVQIPGGSMMQIVDSLGNFALLAQVSDEGNLQWGLVLGTDRCQERWLPVKIEFSADRRIGKVLLPIIGGDCGVTYDAAKLSGTLRRM